MRTSPATVFTMNEKKLLGADMHWVIELTDGASTWYFGDTMMELTEGFVYPLMKSNWTITQRMDPFSKNWSIGTLTIKLKNGYYKKDTSSDDVRASDELAGIRGQAATLYAITGSGGVITSLASHALDYFNGVVVVPPEYDDDEVSIKIYDVGKTLHTTLPQNTIGSEWADAPLQTINDKIPLCYGTFTLTGGVSESFDYSGLGMAKGVRVSKSPFGIAVFGDHISKSISNMVLLDGWEDPASYNICTYDEDYDSAYTVAYTGTSVKVDAYMRLADNEDDGWSDSESLEPPDNPENIWDRDESTYASMNDSIDDGTDTEARAAFHITSWPGEYIHYVLVSARVNDVSGSSEAVTVKLVDIENDTVIATGALSGNTPLAWYATSDLSSSVQSNGTPNGVYISMPYTSDPEADGTPDNEEMLRVYDLHIQVRYGPTEHWDVYAEVEGREYGAWIDEHSASSYTEGDLIEDPAGIIESILIDELGLTYNDIDMDSFDASENSDVVMRINLHSDNEAMSNEVIKQICEQSTFAFCFTAEGKAKLIPLNDDSPTTDATIPWSHIIPGSLKISKSDYIINNLIVNSKYQQEYSGVYRDRDEYDDATSQAAFGTLKYEASWQNIEGTSAAHVAGHLVTASTGIWSNEHTEIEFDMKGFTGVRHEIGDWIELDDETVDGHLLCYGESWSGKQFLITGLTQKNNSTHITAIELH